MLLDVNALPEGQRLEADIVIVGAGAAGITLALEFVGTRHKVILVESGGLDLDGETQALNEGEVIGTTYDPLAAVRSRGFGGTTSMWTGWCKPLDPIDFRPRPWLGLAGWPIERAELQPFYERAQQVVEAGTYRYDRGLWEEIAAPLHGFDPGRLGLTFWQKSPPTRFGQRYRDQLSRADNVTVLLHATLVGMVTNERGDLIERCDLRSPQGRTVSSHGWACILACGGIENARLLLAAAPQHPQGLGNERGQVGRCFMEHPQWRVATVHAADPYRLLDSYYRRTVAGRAHRSGWSLSDAAQERLGVTNCAAELAIEVDRNSGAYLAGSLWRQLAEGEVPDDLGRKVVAVLGDLGGVIGSAWRKNVLGANVNTPPEAVHLLVTLDPMPRSDSRVLLGEDRDALGLPRVKLDWRLSADDERSMAALARAVADELTRLGLARVRLHAALQDPAGGWARAGNLVGYGVAPEAPEMHISWHHMGTTRMAADPAQGVVDATCRVHGTGNLYLAGSSVFPTTGNANPTLTIVALALRLADHLKHGPIG
jgi:choline dehydrogenase-like flavoprotein